MLGTKGIYMKKSMTVAVMAIIVFAFFSTECFSQAILGCYHNKNGKLENSKRPQSMQENRVADKLESVWRSARPSGPQGPPGPKGDQGYKEYRVSRAFKEYRAYKEYRGLREIRAILESKGRQEPLAL